MNRFLGHLFLAVLLPACAAADQAAGAGFDEKLYVAGQQNEHDVYFALIPILREARIGARIYYATDCPANLESPYHPYPFPKTNVQPWPGGISGLAAVQAAFQSDKNVKVSENPDGVINIVIGQPSVEILSTHIKEVKLELRDKYDATFAMNAIRNNADVQAAAAKLGIHMNEVRGLGYLPSSYKEGDPVIFGPLKDLTLDQALGVVAKELKIIVMYGTCTGQKIVSIDSIGGPDFHTSGLTR